MALTCPLGSPHVRTKPLFAILRSPTEHAHAGLPHTPIGRKVPRTFRPPFGAQPFTPQDLAPRLYSPGNPHPIMGNLGPAVPSHLPDTPAPGARISSLCNPGVGLHRLVDPLTRRGAYPCPPNFGKSFYRCGQPLERVPFGHTPPDNQVGTPGPRKPTLPVPPGRASISLSHFPAPEVAQSLDTPQPPNTGVFPPCDLPNSPLGTFPSTAP